MIENISSALQAVQEVAKRNRELQDLHKEYSDFQAEQERAEDTLEHRVYVRENYDALTRECRDTMKEANLSRIGAETQREQLSEQREGMSADLALLKQEHAEARRPLKAQESDAKAQQEACARTLQETRRAVKLAEAQVQDATNKRDQALASASHALDAASERLNKLEAEIAQHGGKRRAAELEAEQQRVKAAERERDELMDELQQSIKSAQTHLWTHRQSLELAEAQAQDAKTAYTEAKEALDSLVAEQQEAENSAEDAIHDVDDQIDELNEQIKQQQAIYTDAKDTLDEAEYIFEHPEEEQDLRDEIESRKAQMALVNAEIESKQAALDHLKSTTRAKRIAVIAALVLIVIIIIAIIYFIVR